MTTSITGQGITAYKVPDDALSNESKNAVQNKVINGEVTDLQNAISHNEETVADTQSMIATVETTTTASKNYAVGDLLVYDGKLYEVISAIATGATITVGTNVTQTTVESQIASSVGGGGEIWYEATISETAYDSTLKMILFDAGSGNSIKDIIVSGAISNDGTNESNETIYFGFGNTIGRYHYSCPVATQSIAASQKSIHFMCYLKRIMTPPRSAIILYTIFPIAFFYGTGGAVTGINVDQSINTTGILRSTNFYTNNFSDPRYFKIELPHWIPAWASIKIFYTLQ